DEPHREAREGDYFPVVRGGYWMYDVEETIYQFPGDPHYSAYQLLIETVDSLPSSVGYTYILQRSRRTAPEEPWHALDTWSARKTKEELIIAEGNTPFAKLRFPVRRSARWNGNAWNNLGDDEYTITEIDAPAVINDLSFERTLTVEQEMNDDRIVFRDERTEMYAEGVGLIYQQVVQLHYCTDDACLGQEKVEQVVERTMRIIGY